MPLTDRTWIAAGISAPTAGIVAIVVTVLVEKLGGLLGGILGTLPSSVVPAAIGLVASATNAEEVLAPLYNIPAGMCATVLFLLLWREIPSRPAFQRLSSLRIKLTLMVLVTLGAWAAAAAGISALSTLLRSAGVPVRLIGIVCCVVNTGTGIAASLLKFVPAPAGKRQVGPLAYVMRGFLAAVAIFLAILLSSLSPVVGGIFSVFPAIFLTAMTSLWIAQGAAVPAGATGPLMVGMLAVALFPMLFAELFAALRFAHAWAAVPAAALSAAVAYVLAALCGSLPMYAFLRWVQRRAQQRAELQPVPDAPETGVSVAATEEKAGVTATRADDERQGDDGAAPHAVPLALLEREADRPASSGTP